MDELTLYSNLIEEVLGGRGWPRILLCNGMSHIGSGCRTDGLSWERNTERGYRGRVGCLSRLTAKLSFI
jgi:hypothetical protein